MTQYTLIAACAFGMEALVKRELVAIGITVLGGKDGRVFFEGDEETLIKANLWLRTADRIGIELASFPAESFDDLFDQTTVLPWSEWLPRDAFIHISARSNKSKLFSLRDCQKIVKKAIIESLKKTYHQQEFAEDGARFPIEIAIDNDQAKLILDTTGPSLHKRGYRSDAGQAPLKETLAAALVLLSRWRSERQLVDPMCGSGTILIEAAMIAKNQAPGLQRKFQAESWPWMDHLVWKNMRQQARQQILPADFRLLGSDSDAEVLKKARVNIEAAGLSDCIALQNLPLAEFRSRKKFGCWISNPPYGERMSDITAVNQVYRDLRKIWGELDSWSYFLLSPDAMLETKIGRKASKRRKLFNGKIACQYYQFLGPLPPLPHHADYVDPRGHSED